MGSRKRQIERKIKKAQEPKPRYNGVMKKTTRGVWVECLPVKPLFDMMQVNIAQSIEWPETPTRTMSAVGGEEIDEGLTQAYIDGQYSTPEEKAEWAEYLAALEVAKAEYDAKIEGALGKFLATEGTRLADESLRDEWREADERLGMTIPDDPHEQAAHFLMTRIMGNAETDTKEIMLGIFRASGYDKEVLDAVEATFRDEVGRRERDTAEESPGDPGPPAEETPGVVGEPELHAGSGEGEPRGDAGPVADDDATGTSGASGVVPGQGDDDDLGEPGGQGAHQGAD